MDEQTREKINDHYQKGQGSIQDIARVYRCTVAEVLEIIGQSELLQVVMEGDQITEAEAGPGATINYGRTETINFTID